MWSKYEGTKASAIKRGSNKAIEPLPKDRAPLITLGPEWEPRRREEPALRDLGTTHASRRHTAKGRQTHDKYGREIRYR